MMRENSDKLDKLLEDCADELGKKGAEEFLAVDTSTVELPKSVDRRISRAIKRESRRESSVHRRGFSRIAASVIVCLSLGFALAMSVEAVREAVFDTIIKISENLGFSVTDEQSRESLGVKPDKTEEFLASYPRCECGSDKRTIAPIGADEHIVRCKKCGAELAREVCTAFTPGDSTSPTLCICNRELEPPLGNPAHTTVTQP